MGARILKDADDDCVEAEIVSGPGSGGKTEGASRRREKNGPGPVNPPQYGILQRIKFALTVLGLLSAFALIFFGILLTSTVIGAVIGIPLLLLGGLCFWIVFKLLSLGQKNGPIIFRRF